MIATLEAVALEAWPPRDRIDFDGWVLCESGGFTRRTNSVYPFRSGKLSLGDKLAFCEAFYAERAARAVFKLTPSSPPPSLDEVLEARGYVRSAPTSVQTVGVGPGWFSADPSVRSRPTFRLAWLRDCATFSGHSARDMDALRETLSRISASDQPCAFTWLEEGGVTLALGLGVVCGGFVYLCEIATRPDLRRRGLGRRIVESLLEWGAEQGAETGLLQVELANEAGLTLYAKLGFEERYQYWYREADWVG